ncbi:hypothetical protein BB559_006594 [Furculomyces boomerangus]|uniref:PSMD12/CSN4-like N-terminal domain-containing protein n=1 Tax=Furculomyces boomerangus TaxID=61424 RepID=A0A2T9Y1M1_9FUNG|nr:hypothetical protein BB559_006594 [Furculomyces boomerangus]
MEVDGYTPAVKMEKSYENETSEALIQAQYLMNSGDVSAAIELLLVLEKKTRKSSDVKSNTRILEKVIEMCHESGDWRRLNEQLKTLSSNHGNLDQSVSSMIKKAVGYLGTTPDQETETEYIITLRKITEGKMLVEKERAKLTRLLSEIYEKQGDIEQANDIIQEDQIETFGSLDKREKTDFILEQMRLCLARNDYVKMAIISKKINISYFKNKEAEDLKLRYYELMIMYGIHEVEYLEVSNHYFNIFSTESISSDEKKWPDIVARMVVSFAQP